jgi:UDP-2,3-diacylglucosamine hydrolase
MNASPQQKIYFLSDFHLGAPNYASSLEREKKIVAFLHSIQSTAAAIFIVGDMFDFWYEYKKVVPKGYTRLLGKLAEITDGGVPVYFFVGNHDMWMSGYFEQELNIKVFYEPQEYQWNGKQFLIGHGDGLGPGDYGYKFLKKVFRNPLCQWLFGVLHPSWGIGLANYFSRKSREKTGTSDEHFMGEDKEWLVMYCRTILSQKSVDYFIFGHRHYPIDYILNEKSHYINLGDWINNFTYAEFDGNTVQLKKWED